MMEAPRSVNMQPVGMLHLFKSNQGPEKDFLLYPGLNTIGRRRDCTVILPFPFISELHAVIEIPAEGRAPYVRDCGSRNGTHLVRPLRLLRPGKSYHLYDKDLIHFAKLHFQFHSPCAPPICDPEGAIEVEETPSLPVIREPQLHGTSLAKASEEEGEHLEQDQHLTDGDGDNKTDVHDKGSSKGQVPCKDSSGRVQMQGTIKKVKMHDHGVRAFLPQTASHLQPGSPEKATSSKSQVTDAPKPELNGQSVQSDMDKQDEEDTPDVIFVSYTAPRCKASAPAWTSRPTWQQIKGTSKWVHSSASPATQESPRLGSGREIKSAIGKQSGRVQGLLQASNIEGLHPQYSRDKSGSSFKRETQEPFGSSSAPTTSMASELHPAIPKELSIRAESHQQPPKEQNQGAARKHVSAPVVPVFPAHPIERSETLKEPPKTFQSQRVVVDKTFESLTVIPKPSSSLTAEISALQGTGIQSKKAVGIAGSTGKLQPRVQIQRLTLVTNEPFPYSNEQGRGQPWKHGASKEDDMAVEVKMSGSSSQRETQEPCRSSSVSTMSLATKLHPAISKEFPRRTESHQQTPKQQTPEANRKHVSTKSRQYMPTQGGPVLPEHPRERPETLKEPPKIFQSQRVGVGKTCESLTVIQKPSSSLTAQKTALQGTGSQSQRAGCKAGSNWTFQPKGQIQHLTLITNEPSPCPKKQGRGQPRNHAGSKEEIDKPVEVKIARSSSQREIHEPFSSSSAPTMSLATKLQPAISKELSGRTESHQQTPKKQTQEANRKHGSTQSRQYMPNQGVPVLPEHPRERPETLKEPPKIFQSQRVGVGKTCESFTVIQKPSSSLTAQKTALQGTGSQSERAGDKAGSNWTFQPKGQIQHLTLVTNKPSPCPKEQGRGQPQKHAASKEEADKQVEVKIARSSSQRATQEPCKSSSVPTMSLAAKLQPAISKELPRRTESHQQIPKQQKQGTNIKDVSTQSRQYMPTQGVPVLPEHQRERPETLKERPKIFQSHRVGVGKTCESLTVIQKPSSSLTAQKTALQGTGSQSQRAGGKAGSNWTFQPKGQIQHLTLVTNEPSPCPKEQGRGQPQKHAVSNEEVDKQVGIKIAGSSSQRETQEPCRSSSTPTMSLATKLHPAISKELPRRTESHQQTPKKQTQEAHRKHGSTQSRHYMPTQDVPVLPEHPRERPETLKEPPKIFQNQRVGVGKTCESLTVILKPSSSLTAQKTALHGTGSQSKRAGGKAGSNRTFQPKGQIQHLTLVTKEPSPCPKEQGRGQPWKRAASEEEHDKPVEVKIAGSSSQRETQELFSSSSAPTMSLAAKLHPAITKELPRRTESYPPIPKKQKQGATREDGSTESRQYMPTQVVQVLPEHQRERSETLKEPHRIFQSQGVGVGKTCESLTVILKPSSSLTAQKTALQCAGSQSERAGGKPCCNWTFQPWVHIQRLTLVTNEPSPCPKEQGRGQPQKGAAREEDDKPVEVKIAGSSSQRETQEPCRSSSVPTMSLAAKLQPAISKEMPRRTESYQNTPKKQTQGTNRKDVSTQSRQYMPTQGVPVLPEHQRERPETLKKPPRIFQSQRVGVGKSCESLTVILKPSSSLTAQKTALQGAGSQSERAGGTPYSNSKYQPWVQIQRLTLVTNEPSPCPKEQGRGQSQKRAASEEEDDKPVEFKTAVKTPKGRAVLTIQPNKEVKGMPYQSVGQPSLYEEVRAHLSERDILRKRRKLWPTAQEEAQGEEAGASD